MTDLRHKCTKPGQAYVALSHIKLLTASIDLNEKGIRTSKKVIIEIEHRRNLVSWITYTTNIDSLPNNKEYIICTKVHKTMLRANIPTGHLSFLKPIKKRNEKTDTDLSAWSQSSHRSKSYLSRFELKHKSMLQHLSCTQHVWWKALITVKHWQDSILQNKTASWFLTILHQRGMEKQH